MTKNQYIKDNGYMVWPGRESLNNEIKCLLGSFGTNLSSKQVNCFSVMIEKHVKRASKGLTAKRN